METATELPAAPAFLSLRPSWPALPTPVAAKASGLCCRNDLPS